MDVARRFVLAGGGQALQTIIVHPYLYHVEAETEIAEDFHNNCPNVKFLTIIDDHGAWVSRFGDRLEGLEIQTGETSDIAKIYQNTLPESPTHIYLWMVELYQLNIGSSCVVRESVGILPCWQHGRKPIKENCELMPKC